MARNSGKARLDKTITGSLLIAVAALGVATGEAAESRSLVAGIVPAGYRLTIEPDREKRQFQARIILEFDILEPSREVVVNSAGLEVKSARRDGIEDARVIHDSERQELTFAFAEPLSVGRHEILVQYSGSIGAHPPGLYRAFEQDGASSGALYSAMCCLNQARFIAPIWDEGNYKAPFELELVLEKEDDAVSVMPVSRRVTLPDGRVQVSFEPTPAMSPRLFFFAAGHFDRLSARQDGIELAIVVPHGKAEKTGYALGATGEALGYMSSYLGTGYPLPKLDSVFLPGAVGGAIASWGSIQYAERYLTVGIGWSSPEELLVSSAIVAHEVAHQWFANLVTPADISHLWLGEGFAVWFENNATEARHPEWNYWSRAIEYREAAMRLDGRETHAIAQHSVPRANQIIYDKSAQVLRMLEEHAGPNPFQKAIRAFVVRNAYGTVTTEDLWTALEDSSLSTTAEIGRDFTGQSGLPLIEILGTRCADEMTVVRLRQSRFGAYTDARSDRTWRVPVTAQVVGQSEVRSRIVSEERSREFKLDGCGIVKLNVGNVGYFRTLYDEDSFQKLSAEFLRLSIDEKLGLLNDQYALAEAGYAPFGRYLQLVSGLSADSDPLVDLQWVRAVNAFDGYYRERGDRQVFRESARTHLLPILERVGWDAQDGESINVPALRRALIETVSRLGHVDTQLEAMRRYETANGDLQQLPAGSREAIAIAVGAAADMDVAVELHRRAVTAEDVHIRRTYWLALAAAQAPETADYLLERILADPDVDGYLLTEVLVTLATSHPGRVYQFLEAHTKTMSRRLGADGYIALLADVARNSTDRDIAERFASFATRLPGDHGAMVKRVAAEILHRDEVRRRLPETGMWTKLRRTGGLTNF